MVADAITGIVAGFFLWLGIHSLRIAWHLWTYRPTAYEIEREERRAYDMRMLKWWQDQYRGK